MKIAIFASGSGSNAANFVNYFSNSTSIEVALIVCNRRDAYVLERAKSLAIPSAYIPRSVWQEQPDKAMEILNQSGIEFIVLAGYLLKLPPYLIAAFPNRIVNIHPALLPKHGGQGMYGDKVHEAVIAAGDRKSGITIHYVNEHYDEGQIIFQATCDVLPNDTAETVANKVHQLEYLHFPQVVEKVCLKK